MAPNYRITIYVARWLARQRCTTDCRHPCATDLVARCHVDQGSVTRVHRGLMGCLAARAKGLMRRCLQNICVGGLHCRRRHNRAAKKSEREPIRPARSYFWTIRCSGGRTCISGSTEGDASGFLPPMQCKAEHSSWPDNVRMLSMQTRRPRRGRYVAAARTPQAAPITPPANAAFAPVPRIGTGAAPLGVGAGKGKFRGEYPE